MDDVRTDTMCEINDHIFGIRGLVVQKLEQFLLEENMELSFHANHYNNVRFGYVIEKLFVPKTI